MTTADILKKLKEHGYEYTMIKPYNYEFTTYICKHSKVVIDFLYGSPNSETIIITVKGSNIKYYNIDDFIFMLKFNSRKEKIMNLLSNI